MKPIFIIGLLLCLIMPVSAQLVGYTAPSGMAVWAIDIEAPAGSTGSISLTQANGDITSGTWSYTGYPLATASVTFGGDSDSFTYITPLSLKMQIWNGDNESYDRQLKLGFGQVKPIWNKVLMTSVKGSPITSYTIGSGSMVTVTPEIIEFSKASSNLNPPEDTSYVDLAIKYGWVILGLLTAAFFWAKFFLWDHLTLTIALWIGITGAMSFNAGRKRGGVFYAIRMFIGYQKKLFEFIIDVWKKIIELLANAPGMVASTVRSLMRLLGI